VGAATKEADRNIAKAKGSEAWAPSEVHAGPDFRGHLRTGRRNGAKGERSRRKEKVSSSPHRLSRGVAI